MRKLAGKPVRLLAAAGLGAAGLVLLFTPTPPQQYVAAPDIKVLPGTIVDVCPRLSLPDLGQDINVDGSLSAGQSTGRIQAGSVPQAAPTPGELSLVPLPEQEATTSSAGEAAVGQQLGSYQLAELAGTGGAWLQAPPVGQQAAQVAGYASVAVTESLYSGFAAAPCTGAASEVWLVGGSASASDGGTLRLANPGRRQIEVEVAYYGSTGEVQDAHRELTLAPGAVSELQLEAALVGEERPAVRVSASGGGVAAALLSYTATGLQGEGISVLTGSHLPAPLQVIPGVLTGGQDSTVVRLVNPTAVEASVEVNVSGEQGMAPLPGAEAVRVPPGVVVDVPLTGVVGKTAIVARADQPIVASARTNGQAAQAAGTTGRATASPDSPSPGAASAAPTSPAAAGPEPQAGQVVDHAWIPAASAAGAAVSLLPPDVSAELYLTNAGDAAAEVRVGGQQEPVRLAPGGTQVLPLAPQTVWLTIDTDAPAVHAMLLLTGPQGQIEALPLTQPADRLRDVPAWRGR
ncbi:DUF5719 family protein [Buchananella hordeovulneris]|uniref:DUF5719 family protein n=1 Tax=Buchananella hordeovulneris TaxID=52770 RepID=UPI000F5DDBC5|nr:DUF5719 family protein [Buchananella hordeovulneris]RRD44521.1 hypothetical protein EII13_03335 [Buchananella hordeovulneris]